MEEVSSVVELCRPLGNTLQLLARRIDALLFDEAPGRVQDELRRVRLLTTDALHTLGDVADLVDTARLRDARLDVVLRRACADFAGATGACVEVRTAGSLDIVPPATADVLARVAREALVHVDRFARVSVVLVTVSVRDDRVVLEVKDDGVDLAQRQVAEWGSTAAFSVSAIARLVGAAGGRFAVSSTSPRGLCLRADLPLLCRGSVSRST